VAPIKAGTRSPDVPEIGRSQVKLLLDKIAAKHPRMADVVKVDLQVLEKFYAEGVDDYTVKFKGLRNRSPAEERDRVLSEEEIRIIWYAADKAERYGALIKLLLLSAQRREKVISMRYSDINLKTGEWRIPHKAGEKGTPAVLALPPVAIAIIESQTRLGPYVFPAAFGHGFMLGLSQRRRMFNALLPPDMPPWVLHDLRRTARTLMMKIRVKVGDGETARWVKAIDSDTAEAILGHKIPGVKGVYARHDFGPEMKEALVYLADYVATIVGSDVVSSAQAA
jgi:integrase